MDSLKSIYSVPWIRFVSDNYFMCKFLLSFTALDMRVICYAIESFMFLSKSRSSAVMAIAYVVSSILVCVSPHSVADAFYGVSGIVYFRFPPPLLINCPITAHRANKISTPNIKSSGKVAVTAAAGTYLISIR